jgi:hypothetical protein
MKFMGKSKDNGLQFQNNNKIVTYPETTIREQSIYHVFSFDDIETYDKFRSAIALKFNLFLPDIEVNENFANSKFIREGRAQEIVHKNPSVGTIKALAKNNKYGSVRFVIYKDGTIVAADSEHFTHHSMAPAMGAWEVRGYIQHLSDNDYAYRSMNVYDPMPKDHPLFKKWERLGIENGNDNESLNENFADGKGPGRPGDSQRHGIPKKATMAQLEKAAKAKGRKGQLARWQLNMRRGKKKVNENTDDRKQAIAEFVKFALAQLKCEHKPKIKLVTDNQQVQDYKSFGGTSIQNGEIWVYIQNRNLADLLRTLCHELVHYKQFKDGRIKGPEDGKTGSELENEANSQAGIILRHYGKMNPSIFESK